MLNSVARFRALSISGLAALLVFNANPLQAETIVISHTDFTMAPVFNNLDDFNFSIEVDAVLAPGTYSNPTLLGVVYSVNGNLPESTPSGFPGFNLSRNIGGAEFYTQGSSLDFVIAATADLSDGVQVTEFESFTFNGLEMGTGRYHPALLQFLQNGTGSIRNSNNTGGINGGSGQLVDVDFGEEYIVNLSFDPAIVPLPAGAWFFGSALGLLGWIRRRKMA